MTPVFSVLLVDDEAGPRADLMRLLGDHPDMRVVGQAKDGGEAVMLVESLHPDLMFLDVQMPVLNGFEVLHHLKEPPPTIFLTAYTEFAVRAFEVAAVDYLLKPPTPERFNKALIRFRKRGGGSPEMEPLMKELGDVGYLQRIRVSGSGKTQFIPTRNICWFEADSGYVSFLANGQTHMIDMTIKKLEERLDPAEFLRIHRKVIIRKAVVSSMKRQLSGCYQVHLEDGRSFTVSRSYVSQFRASMRQN